MTVDADELAEMARNRGLKLVRSRIRTPGKRGYGKFGLTDASGQPVLGIDGKHLSATAEEVEAYLRKEVVSDWAKSAGQPAPKRTRRPRRAAEPPPPPKPEVRKARAADAAARFSIGCRFTGPSSQLPRCVPHTGLDCDAGPRCYATRAFPTH